MAWDKYKVRQPISNRQPSEKSLLAWCQKEVHVILGELRRVVNWAVDWLGLVQVVSGDTPGTLDSKLTVSGGLAKSVVTAVDGTSTLDISGSAFVTDKPFDPHFFAPEVLIGGATLAVFAIEVACSFPAGLTGAVGKSGSAATAESVITIKKNGSSVGTVTFAAAGSTATFAAASPIVLAVGDVLQFVNQSTADATLADVAIALKGVRT